MASHAHAFGTSAEGVVNGNPNGRGTGFTPRGNQRAAISGNRPYHTAHHYHEAENSGGPSPGTYGNTAQDVGTTSNTEPQHRTVAYLSAPSEPASGNAMFFGANF